MFGGGGGGGAGDTEGGKQRPLVIGPGRFMTRPAAVGLRTVGGGYDANDIRDHGDKSLVIKSNLPPMCQCFLVAFFWARVS